MSVGVIRCCLLGVVAAPGVLRVCRVIIPVSVCASRNIRKVRSSRWGEGRAKGRENDKMHKTEVFLQSSIFEQRIHRLIAWCWRGVGLFLFGALPNAVFEYVFIVVGYGRLRFLRVSMSLISRRKAWRGWWRWFLRMFVLVKSDVIGWLEL